MPKHAAPRTRSPFWSTLAASTAVAAIVSGAVSSVPLAHNEPQAAAQATVWEDSPLWDCTMMGNHICGPGNTNGVPAGCYDQGGVMVKPWFRYDDPTQDDLWANLYPADETGHRPICSDIWGPDTAGYDGTDAGIAQYDYDYGLPIEGYGVDPSKVYDHSKPYGWAAR